MPSHKIRLDRLLADQALAPTREKAAALILEGLVFVDGVRVDKAGTAVSTEARIDVKGKLPYVGRGGQKLEAALAAFGIDPAGKVVLDTGASTGGFTDCLLQRGARRVYAVDVGYGQLDWHLRQDPRVLNFERTHILKFDWRHPELLREPVVMATLDLSFISLTKVLPLFHLHLPSGGIVLSLIKPQFEVGKGEVGKNGVVRDPEKQRKAVEKVTAFAEQLSFEVKGVVPSVILGQKGNKEFFIYLVK
jgi:23S rRNA (cytidine1920-2'-O)/16S rRNA (cytidine1409-2'-O)-methyltransferase